MADFSAALKLVLTEEGGKVNNPKDPGGRTNKGITQRTYDAWRKASKQPKRDVYLIADAEVEAIYRNQFADHVKFDQLPNGVGYAVFDEAVNSGPVQAAKDLQRALGVSADGVIGALTLAKCQAVNRTAVVNKLCDGRLTFMRRLKAWATFGKGWANRVAFVRTNALKMASA